MKGEIIHNTRADRQIDTLNLRHVQTDTELDSILARIGSICVCLGPNTSLIRPGRRELICRQGRQNHDTLLVNMLARMPGASIFGRQTGRQVGRPLCLPGRKGRKHTRTPCPRACLISCSSKSRQGPGALPPHPLCDCARTNSRHSGPGPPKLQRSCPNYHGTPPRIHLCR